MRGGDRRSKPAALRAVQGSRTRPRHAGKELVVPAVVTLLQPPSHLGLTLAEAAIWTAYAPMVIRTGLVTGADLETFAAYCRATWQVRDIRQQQQAPDYRRLMLPTAADALGNDQYQAVTNPLDAQLRAWMQIARLLAAELGMTPMSRARVTSTPVELLKTNPIDRFLRRASA